MADVCFSKTILGTRGLIFFVGKTFCPLKSPQLKGLEYWVVVNNRFLVVVGGLGSF